MALTYVLNNNLYVNITNLCTNRCAFCIRDAANQPPAFQELRLEREPTLQEIVAELAEHDLDAYSEIVFCGYGEPTCRLYDMLETCKRIRERSTTPIRVDTNGHASMIAGEDTAPAFRGLVDCVSISLNAADSDTYCQVCHPRFGEDTFVGVVKFAREVIKYVPKVLFTVVEGILTDADVARCEQIAAGIGAGFKVRPLLG